MKRILTTLIILVAGSFVNVSAQLSKVGTNAADFLLIPVGARSSAMSAFAATVNDPSAMVLNPAGLADVSGNQVMVEATDWYLDFTHTYMGIAIPTKKGVAGVHVLAMDYGEFEETTAEAMGKTGRTFGAYSVSFGASYAQYLLPQFTIGGTVKMVYEKIANSSASTVAFDVGTMYDTPFYGIRFAVGVTNIGSKMQMTGNDLIIRSDPDRNQKGNYEPDAYLATDEFDLPLRLRVGFAWDAIDTDELRATFSLDGNNPTNNLQSISLGGELSFLGDRVQLRGGIPYIGLEDAVEKFNAGIGFKYDINSEMAIGFNYTYHGFNYLGDVNKLNVQIYF